MGSPLDVLANYNPSGMAAANQGAVLQNQIRAAQLPGVQAESQVAQAQALQAQISQRDQQLLGEAWREGNGDPNKIRQLAIQKGMSPQGVMQFNAQDAQLQKAYAELADKRSETGKRLLDTEVENEKRVGAGYSTILDIDKDKRAELAPAILAHIAEIDKTHPVLTLDQVMNDDALKTQIGQHQYAEARGAQIKQAADTAETQAKTAGEQAKAVVEKRKAGLQELTGLLDENGNVADPAGYQALVKSHPELMLPAQPVPQIIADRIRSGVEIDKQPEYLIRQRMLSMSPQDRAAMVDSVVPPRGDSAQLNSRTKALVEQAARAGDMKGVQAAIKDASDQLGKTETGVRTVQAEQPGKIAAAVATASALAPIRSQVEARKEYSKSGMELSRAQASADTMQQFIDLARSGNKAAGSNLPLVGVETLNAANGIKRINGAEIAQYSGAGSLLDKIQGKIGSLVNGQPIPADVLKDMETLHKKLVEGAHAKHAQDVQVINGTYGTSLKPMEFVPGTHEAAGNATAAPKATHRFNPATGKIEPIQ